MIGGLIDLGELEVSDVMVHRIRMRTICADQEPQAIVREVLASPYTRLPLWSETPDNIIGILHAKDLLRALDAEPKGFTHRDYQSRNLMVLPGGAQAVIDFQDAVMGPIASAWP